MSIRFPLPAGWLALRVVLSLTLLASFAFAQLPDLPPQAVAGSDRDASTGTTVVLDGRGSFDPDGQALTYLWTAVAVPAGSRATIFGAATFLASITPDVAGDYFVQLRVATATGSGVDAVRVRVTGVAAVVTPTARIRAPATILPGDRVELDGSGSVSPSGALLSYRWRQTFGLPGTLSGASSSRAGLRPLSAGFVTVELTVNDGVRSSLPATATVIVLNQAPRAPVADAGGDRSGVAGQTVRLSGRILAPRPDAVTVRWTYEGGPLAGLAITDAARPVSSFLPAVPGNYSFKLSADDGQTQDEDHIVVRVSAAQPAAAGSGSGCALIRGGRSGGLELPLAALLFGLLVAATRRPVAPLR